VLKKSEENETGMKKIIVIAALMLLLTLTACGAIEDTNGADDTTLSSIAEDEILGLDMGWQVVGLKETVHRV